MNFELFTSNGVIISGQPKSGTTLLASLLDGHSNLSCLPFEYYYLHQDKLKRRQPLLPQVLSKKYIATLESPDKNSSNSFGMGGNSFQNDTDFFLFSGIAEKLWASQLEGESAKSLDALCVLVTAYRQSIFLDENSLWCIKNPKYEYQFQKILDDFSDIKLLHVVRDPREVIVSRHIKARNKQGLNDEDANKQQIVSLNYSYLKEWAKSAALVKLFEDRIFVVRYEDLVVNPENIMRKVADYLGIPFEITLLQPTLNKTPWKDNSVRGGKSDAVIKQSKSTYNEYLKPRQLAAIEGTLWGEMSFLNYKNKKTNFIFAKVSFIIEEIKYRWPQIAKVWGRVRANVSR